MKNSDDKSKKPVLIWKKSKAAKYVYKRYVRRSVKGLFGDYLEFVGDAF